MHQHQSNDPFEGPRTALNIATFVAQTGAVTVEVFLHRRFGARYVAAQGAAAMILIPVFASFGAPADPRPLLQFLGAYLVMCLFVRIDAVWRQRRSDCEHSRYSGYPRILPFRWYRLEWVVKQAVEPFLVLLIGSRVAAWNEPLGNYLVFAALCLFVSNGLIRISHEQRVMELRDAMLEQEHTAQILRELRQSG